MLNQLEVNLPGQKASDERGGRERKGRMEKIKVAVSAVL